MSMRWIAAFAAAFIALSAGPTMATEEAPYALVRAESAIEIRDYPALITALTQERGDRAAASNPAFRRLAGYIFDDARPEGEIEMTTPVLMTSKDDKTSMRFVMPQRLKVDDLPAPRNAKISIDTVPARRVAAIGFSGWADDDDLIEKERELRAWLADNGLTAVGRAEWAFYNPPWTLGPWRRNEVLIEIAR